jgi:hypothetical protein
MSYSIPSIADVECYISSLGDYGNKDQAKNTIKNAFRDARLAVSEHTMQREIILDQARTIALHEANVARLSVGEDVTKSINENLVNDIINRMFAVGVIQTVPPTFYPSADQEPKI